MCIVLLIKLNNFRKRKTHIAHHRTHVENLLKGPVLVLTQAG